MRLSHLLRSSFLTLATFCCLLPTTMAQLEGTLAPKPLGTGYLRGLNQQSMFQYIEKLSKRLEIGDALVKAMGDRQDIGSMDPKVEVPIHGAAYFLVQGLIPSWETMYFQQVADAADGKRVLNARSKMFGQNAGLEDVGADCFLLTNKNSWNSAVPKGKSAEEHAKQINDRQPQRRRGYSNTAKVIEKDGKKQIEQTWQMTEYYRLQENLLFSSNFEELWTADLPNSETLLSTINSTDDMGIEVFFDRIPQGIKTLGWGMLSGGAGAQMQQRDGEEPTIANLRKRSIEFGLDLVKAVIFDVDQANGWLRFATEEEQSIRGEVNFDTRSNSEFAKRLEEWSSGHSRFGAILRDDAPATLHLCIKLFEESDPMLDAVGQWFIQQVSQESSGDSRAVSAATEIARTLNGIGEHQTLELMLKAGWTEATNGVFYGGIQVDHNANLLRSLFDLATNIRTPPEGLFELVEKDGVEMIRIQIPETERTMLTSVLSLSITDVYVAHQNSCLWFAAGHENAYLQVLAASEKSASSNRGGRAPLFTGNVAFDEWLMLPEDDPVGVGNLIRWLDENEPLFPVGWMGIGFGARGGKPNPVLSRVKALGGDEELDFTVIADKAGLRGTLKIGEAPANYYIARMIDAQDRQMSQSMERAKKAQEEAAKKAKAKASKKKGD